jgi:acetyl esterase/lipase
MPRHLCVNIAAILLVASTSAAQADVARPRTGVSVTEPVALPDGKPPFSSLASEEARQNMLNLIEAGKKITGMKPANITEIRRNDDDLTQRPSVIRLRARFPVLISPEKIAGVPVDAITPAEGVSARNAKRVLISLHGGGFYAGAGLGGQAQSIPIASLGKIKVISVDYRQGPEYRFPAASEDVASVYRELLNQYRPQDIGIYGCSAGGWLTAESIAWFQVHDLPRPGAIGIFGAGALIFDGVTGDSAYLDWALSGAPKDGLPRALKFDYFDVPGLDMRSALVSPAYSEEVLARFPPTLLIGGMRDSLLSGTVYTHSKLVKLGVDADLHVWEGAFHCSFAQGVVEPNVPETREAWDVIVKFFNTRLGG